LAGNGLEVVAVHMTTFLVIWLRNVKPPPSRKVAVVHSFQAKTVSAQRVNDQMLDDLRKAALEYHRVPTPGKIEVAATKSLITQRDLALAYTPGVAAVCEAIVEDPRAA